MASYSFFQNVASDGEPANRENGRLFHQDVALERKIV